MICVECGSIMVKTHDVLNMGDPSGPSLGRFKAAKREMQRRGF